MAIYLQKLFQTNTDVKTLNDDPLYIYVQTPNLPSGHTILSLLLNIYLLDAYTPYASVHTIKIYKNDTYTQVGSFSNIDNGEFNQYYSTSVSEIPSYYRLLVDDNGWYDHDAMALIDGKDSSNPAYLQVQYALGNESSKPTNFTVIQSGTDINTSFTYVGSGQTNDSMTGYEIQYRIDGLEWKSIDITSTNTSYTLGSDIFEGATGDINVDVRVRTKNNLTSTYSVWSDTVNLTYESKNPLQPSNFSAVQSGGVVDISWTYKQSTDGTDVQIGADIQYSFDGVNWNTLSYTGTANTYSIEESYLNDITILNRTVYIRIRTKNNLGGTSAWTESIQINYKTSKPVSPSNLQPFGQQLQGAIKATWQFNDTGRGDIQQAYELQYKCEGQTEYTTVTGTTASEYTFQNLVAGTVLWKVRVQSSLNVWSDYSVEASFIYAVPPGVPSIISGTTFDISKPTIQWTSEGQTSFRLQVLKGTEIYFDTQEVASSATSYTLEKALENNTQYTLKLRIKNRFALWSDYATKTISTAFLEPNQPNFSLVNDFRRASVHLIVSNPVTSEISTNEILRRRYDEAEWTVIGETIANGEFVDYTLTTDTQYEYKVRAVTSEGGYKDSEVQNTSVRVKNTQLSNTENYEEWVELKYNPSKSYSKSYNKKLVNYAGRSKPVVVRSPEQTWKMNMSFTILKEEIVVRLLELVDKQEILLLRDSRGKNKYIFVTSEPQVTENNIPRTWEVSFGVTEVDYND